MANLPRGIRNNNPLNIRRNPANRWQGRCKNPTDSQFEQFEDMLFGFRAAFILVRTYMSQRGVSTLTQIVNLWAPPSENNTAAYIASVESLSRVERSSKLDFKQKRKLCAIVRAMAIVENGVAYTHMFSPALISSAYDMV